MTVKDLITELQNADPESEVYFAYNYGDYTRTTVCANVRRVDHEEPIVYSGYHNMYRLASDDDNTEITGTVLA